MLAAIYGLPVSFRRIVMINTYGYTFPTALTEIEDEAFAGIPVETLVIPDRIENIGSKAFAGCPNLLLVFIGEDTGIGANVFQNCPKVILCGPAGGNVETYANNNGLTFAEWIPDE